MEEPKKERVLIIGATGRLGLNLAEFSLRSFHPTFALLRPSSLSAEPNSETLRSLSASGITILKGSLEDEQSLVEAVKQVDIVICAVPTKEALSQKLLIRVIHQSASIKRFIPAEFGCDPDRTRISDLDGGFYSKKSEIRRMIESLGVPYTYICCNFFMRLFLPSLVQPGQSSPPRDTVTIFGDGNTKGVFMNERDVAEFTIMAMNDPRTLNKALHFRPPGNVYSMNELVEIWEGKIGKKLERVFVSEQELIWRIHETPYPKNMEMVFVYSAFVKGDQTYFEIEDSGGVDGTKLYPEVRYTTISEFLDSLV